MNITVAVHPTSGPTLENEFELLKSALLFGDHVTLCSHKAWVLGLFAPMEQMSPNELLDFIIQVIPRMKTQMGLDIFPDVAPTVGNEINALLRKKKGLSTQENIRKLKFINAYTESIANLRDTFRTSGTDQLRKLMADGRVSLYEFHDLDTPSMAKEYVNFVSDAIQDGSAYPMLDDGTGSLMRSLGAPAEISQDVDMQRIRYVRLADNLFHRLPGFSEATLDEVVDIRSELTKPLTRFRAGLTEISNEIRSTPWENDFEKEIDILVQSKVEPAILEIEEQMAVVPSLAKFLKKPQDMLTLAVATGSVCALIAPLGHIEPLTLAALGAVVGAGATAVQGVFDSRDKASQNQMYFYYKVEQKLK